MILTLIVLMLFGGVTIRTFVLALLVGITTGTYSSIFVASMLLVSWHIGELKWLWPFRRRGLRPLGRRSFRAGRRRLQPGGAARSA